MNSSADIYNYLLYLKQERQKVRQVIFCLKKKKTKKMNINKNTSKQLGDTDFFVSIIPYIKFMRDADRYVEIELPKGSTIYGDKVLSFFNKPKIKETPGQLPRMTGFVKDPVVYNFLKGYSNHIRKILLGSPIKD